MNKRKKRKRTVGVLYFRNIPPIVKARFKAMCAERGTNMTKETGRLMFREVMAYERKLRKDQRRKAKTDDATSRDS